MTALLAGTAPADVTEFDWSWTGQFSAAGWYEPLNDKIDAATLADIKGSSIFTVDGKLLGVPYSNDFRVMLVNKKHFADAGITEMPKTLDELVADAKKIKEKGIVKYPIGLPLSPTEGASTSWYLLTKAFGGDLFDKDFNPLFVSPDSAGYKAMAFETDAARGRPGGPGIDRPQGQPDQRGRLRQGPDQHHDLGRAWTARPDERPQAVRGRRRCRRRSWCRPSRGKTRSYGLLEALAIPKVSQHKEAALEFIKWFTSKDWQMENYANGFLPTRTSALAALNDEGKLISGDALVEESKYVEPLFPQGTPTWYPQFSSAVNTAINSVAKGEVTVDQAMKNIAEATKQAMAQ